MKLPTRRFLELGGLASLYFLAVLYVHITRPEAKDSGLAAAPAVVAPVDAPPIPTPEPAPPAKRLEAKAAPEAVDRIPEPPPKPAANSMPSAVAKSAVPTKRTAQARAQPAVQPQSCPQQPVYYECRPRGRRHRRWFYGD